MGTTSSVLVLLPQGALVAHIGDSRIYRLRGDKLQQLTFDHSLQWELKASGAVKEGADLAAIVPKNVITRSLGPNPNVQIDLEGPHPMEVGDIFLLCSDGLVRRGRRRARAILARCPQGSGAGPDRPGQSSRRSRQHHGDDRENRRSFHHRQGIGARRWKWKAARKRSRSILAFWWWLWLASWQRWCSDFPGNGWRLA